MYVYLTLINSLCETDLRYESARIADPETVRFLALHQHLPDPDTPYPGTSSKGSLSSLSRAPILPAPTAFIPDRHVIGIDPGQANHITATLLNPREAYGALVAGQGAQVAKQAFSQRFRQVKGKHSKERRLQGRSERLEALRRAADHERTPEDEVSAQEAMDLLKGLEANTGGTDVAVVSVLLPIGRSRCTDKSCRPPIMSRYALTIGVNSTNSGMGGSSLQNKD